MNDVLKYWQAKTFEVSSYKFNLSERVNKVFKTSGSDNTGHCTYTYNELGYRGTSIYKKGFKIMSIGCSFTEGVGVNDNETWPHQFSKFVPNGLDYNFGAGGRSNDYIARVILSFYDYIKPDLVLILYTFEERREFYTSDGGIEPFMPTSAWGFMSETKDGKKIQNNLIDIQNENQDFINWYKNHLLIKYFLESKGAMWIWNNSMMLNNIEDSDSTFDDNQFKFNYGDFIDLGEDSKPPLIAGHPGPLHQKNYAKNLFEFAKIKYPNLIEIANSKTQEIKKLF